MLTLKLQYICAFYIMLFIFKKVPAYNFPFKNLNRGIFKNFPLLSAELSGRSSAAVSKIQNKLTSKDKLELNPPKGTRDFYPADKRLSNWLFSIWKDVARRYNFEEYDSPVVENEDLYIRKAGEEVTDQLYNFEDKGGRRLSLRPEMTPSLARMVMAKKGALSFPIKWFSIPQCWRYERMTLGRRREHYQWNMDIWGVENVEAEAELLSAIVFAFTSMGLTASDVGIKINSRKILSELLSNAGVPEDKFAPTCVLIDKLEKVPLETLTDDFNKIGLSIDTVNNVVNNLKNRDISEYAKLLGDQSEGVKDIMHLFNLAKSYGYEDWLIFDPSVVRGLAYYTGIVFEGFDRKGQFRAICGGGRYDKLLELFGDEKIPAVGFGFGDAVIVELLRSKNLLPETSYSGVQIVLFSMMESLRPDACSAAMKLREAGYSVDVILSNKKPKWVFQHADRLNAELVVMFAEDEMAKGQVVVKNMKQGKQSTESLSELLPSIQAMLANKKQE